MAQAVAVGGRTWGAAVALLIGTGSLLGLSTTLAKLAAGAGVSAAAFLFWAAAIASGLLWTLAAARGHLPQATPAVLRYSFVAGALTLAAPNLIAFAAVAEIGAAFVTLTFAFPPLLTYVGAVALGMERADAWRALAVLLALAGAVLLVVPRLAGTDGSLVWIASSLMIPVVLAAGNLYRTLAWPPGAAPDALAPPMLLAACLLVAAAAPLAGLTLTVPLTGVALGLVALQGVAFALQYLMYFALQRQGGPVMLSLIGSVASLVGVPVAVGLLGEALPAQLLPAALLVLSGIAILTLRRART